MLRHYVKQETSQNSTTTIPQSLLTTVNAMLQMLTLTSSKVIMDAPVWQLNY